MLHTTRIQIRGSAASMENITAQSLAPYIDLSNIEIPGSYRMSISLENLEGLILDSNLTAMVDIEYAPQEEVPGDGDKPNTVEPNENAGENGVTGGTE
jgi:hypothetical protein